MYLSIYIYTYIHVFIMHFRMYVITTTERTPTAYTAHRPFAAECGVRHIWYRYVGDICPRLLLA